MRQTLPDVALVDLRLPDMRGEELTRELLTRDFPSTAVIILSTYLSEETVRGALDAGAAGYVTKAAGLPELSRGDRAGDAGDVGRGRDGRAADRQASCTRWSRAG